MPNTATTRERRLRKTKAQLIDEIDTLEQSAAAIEAANGSSAPMRAKASEHYLADEQLVHLARFTSENLNPVLRAIPDGTVLYANDAAIAVKGLLKGRKKSTLTRDLAEHCAEASRTAEVQQTEFESGNRVFAFSIAPVTGETYINIYGRDITDRKRAERELAEKEAQLRVALDNMPGGMMLVDRDLNSVLLNPQYSELHDYPDGLLKVGGSMLDELRYQADRGDFGPGDKDDLIEELVANYQRGEAVSYERAITGSGRTLQFNVAPTPEGGYVTIATDITDRKRAEQALRESQQLLDTILDHMPMTVYLRDLDGRFMLINRQYEELHQVTKSGVLGKTLHEVFAKERADDYATLDPEVARQRRVLEREETHRLADGEHIMVVVKFPVFDLSDEVVAVGGIDLDITERKRAERELAEKEAQLRVALDSMPGGIRYVDEDRNYVFFNARYLELYDFPKGLLEVGENYRAENLFQAKRGDFGPGDPEALTDEWIVSLTREAEPQSWERTTVAGKVLQVSTAPTPVGGFVNIVTDITERKRAEEALLEAKRRTEEASKLVAEKNRMLESLSKQLSKYLSPQVYASIFSGEQSVEIASKRKKLTVFFSDIADFTGTTDSLESEELTDLLNHYLTEMSKIALDFGATIDKYVGDAIIAFFGDPETRGVKEDARTCVNMAIAMQRRMRELRSEWLDMGLENPFEVRIGINTGFCTVGNFGSADRMDYTIIGNEVNLAARLESLAEVGGILLAHETHALVKDTVLAEEGDALTVKGFAKPVRTYRVVGLYDDLAEQGRIIRKDEDGLTLIIDRNKLTKKSKARAIKAVEDALSQLKG